MRREAEISMRGRREAQKGGAKAAEKRARSWSAMLSRTTRRSCRSCFEALSRTHEKRKMKSEAGKGSESRDPPGGEEFCSSADQASEKVVVGSGKALWGLCTSQQG